MLQTEVRLLSFDPGITTLGWTYSHYNMDTGELHVKEVNQLKSSKEAKKIKEYKDLVEGQVLALSVLEKEIIRLLDTYQPHFVVSEDCFINMKCPNAHASLTMVLYAISRILFKRYERGNHTTNPRLFKIAPRSIKLFVSGTGKSDKLGIQDAIFGNEKIKFDKANSNLSEHECDSIACAYTFVSTLLQFQKKISDEKE